MIYTITLNPALDYSLETSKFDLGKLNLSEKAYFLGGGKGINVSKVLKNFNVESTAIGFLGGFTGNFIKEELKEKNIKEDFVEVLGNTRVNIKIKTGEIETELAGLSPEINENHVLALKEKLTNIQDGDILVLSGSVPKSLKTTIYKELVEGLDKNIKVILDTRGEAFVETLKVKPFLVKPNHHELEEFCGKELHSLEEIVEGARTIQKLGVQNVIVSMGKDGSILLTEDSVYKGNVPKGTLKNSVGAGDSMVAGLVSKLAQGESLLEAYKFGIASGSATAFSHNLATKDEVLALLNQINIIKV
jgi:1-phosphofructokinase